MGVDIQGEPGREVPQHSADGFDVHTVLQGDGCEGVAEVVESDLRNACPFQHPLQHIIDTVRRDGTTVRRGKHIGVIGFGFLLFENFY